MAIFRHNVVVIYKNNQNYWIYATLKEIEEADLAIKNDKINLIKNNANIYRQLRNTENY